MSGEGAKGNAVRLQKILAQTGIASRRAAERMIMEERITVNGQVVRSLGTKADPSWDKIKVDGNLLKGFEPKVYFVLYKPRGCLTIMRPSTEKNQPTLVRFLRRIKVRVFPVGRLDYDTEGLLLLTNDGDLTLGLTHPRYDIPRRYLVKVKGIPSPEKLKSLKKGVKLKDGWASAKAVIKRVTAGRNSWLEITVREGRHRLIKRLCRHLGYPVQRLKRTQFAFLTLEGLRPGDIRPLAGEEIRMLKELVSQKVDG